MRLLPHSELRGKHANLMAPSNYHWTNYDEDTMVKTIMSSQRARLGDRKHAFAAEAIALRQKQPDIQKTLNMYINDAIGFKMTPEQPLFYSWNCFGTCDAISYRLNPNTGRWMLRIHDLKTGSTRTNMRQLEIYVAIFCFEYDVNPAEIDIELRIYKSDQIFIHIPDLDDIIHIMEQIKFMDKLIDTMEQEANGD